MKWRPISSAPKDKFVLLLYQGCDHLPFVCQGAWVQCPHKNTYMAHLRGELDERGKRVFEEEFIKGSWQVSYISTYSGYPGQHAYWEAVSFLVFPTHWQPLPAPPEKLPRGYEYPQS